MKLLLLLLLFAQDTQEQVLRNLAHQDNRVGIAAYLQSQNPTFHDAAVKAGLAEYLDGTLDWNTFKSRLGSVAFTSTFEKAMGGKDFKPTELKIVDLYKSGAMSDPAKMAEVLQSRHYNGEKHPFAEMLDGKNWGTVTVERIPGKLAWFNPYLNIPELGIVEGKPLTAAQEKALLDLYSVKTVPDGSGKNGRAWFPSDVGRAINPNPGVLSIMTSDGKMYPSTVAKGNGPTSSKITRDGKLEISEAYMDAELSRNLQKTGVYPYVPVAVIEIEPGKAIYVRAADSILRFQHIEKYTAPEARKVIEHIVSQEAGRAPPDAVRAWAEEYVPKTVGRNAGMLSGLGVKHGSLSADNYGLRGELVDWGWAELGHTGSDAQKGSQKGYVEKSVSQANRILAFEELARMDRPALEKVAQANGITIDANLSEAEIRERLLKPMEGYSAKSKLEGLKGQIDVDKAVEKFEAEYAKAKADAANKDIKLGERFLSRSGKGDLRSLANGFDGSPGYNATEAELLEFLKKKGVIVDKADYKELPTQQSRGNRVRQVAKTEATGALHFAAAYLLKEGFHALETGDPERMKEAAGQLKTGHFWKDLAVFTGAARLTEIVTKGAGRSALPLAAGMAAVQLANGTFNTKDFLISTGSFLAAGFAVNAIADGLIYPLLFAAGPPGWIAAGVYTVAKLAVTLYLGEKLDGWIHGLFDKDKSKSATPRTREGVKQKIDSIGK